jgi:copper chaperone CopZ
MAGRTRVHIPERRTDTDYFARVTKELPAIDGVEGVEVNPATGSVLIHHGDDFVSVIRKASELELFDVMAPHQNGHSDELLTSSLAEKLTTADRGLREATQGRFDLNSVTILGLVGAGAFQILRGSVLPAGATLLWYAFGIAWFRPVKKPEQS